MNERVGYAAASGRNRSVTFRVLWAIDAVVASVIVYFFLAGLADGSVSSFNIGLWSTMLLVVAAVLAGGPWLRAAGWPRLAAALLLVLALPGLIYGSFVLLILVTQPRWN